VRAFSQEGPEVTLDAIAKDAGVGIGTLYRFVAYMTTKRGMADALRAVIASGGNPYAHSRELLVAAITAMLSAGARAGTVRSDVAAVDVLTSLSGISLAASEPAQREQAGRMLDLLMDGLRYRAAINS
jgi:AcrR family transcriptional regulator